jgi:disease resistance protein RPS2
MGIRQWKDALEKLKRFDKDGMDGQVYSALELSYNSLKGDGSSILTLWTT